MRRRHDPAVDLWEPLSVAAVSSLIDGTSAWLSGGVGIDHWLGRVTRAHGDVDVSVTRRDRAAFLAGLPSSLRPFAAQDGWLTPLDELGPDDAGPDDAGTDDAGPDNVWCRDQRSGRWVLQVNAEDGDDTTWAYRRDPSVVLPWPRAVLVVAGVRTVAPEVQLLWKSRAPRPVDESDRRNVLDRLDADARTWLQRSIRTAHPGSPWAIATDDQVPPAR